MKSDKFGTGMFLIGVSSLILSISVAGPGCGGGGGGSAKASSKAASSGAVVHTVDGGSVVVPANQFFLTHSWDFTPNGANDEVIFIQVEGDISLTSGSGSVTLFVKNEVGMTVWGNTVSVGTGPFLISQAMTSVAAGTSLPSASYTFEVVVSSDAFWVGSVDNVTLKIIVLESPTMKINSANFS